eukprot:m.15444 g.15444  ORF g.15444 m.15444 type:complete len:85 (-) comp10465_c0_seq2:5-259(-)
MIDQGALSDHGKQIEGKMEGTTELTIGLLIVIVVVTTMIDVIEMTDNVIPETGDVTMTEETMYAQVGMAQEGVRDGNGIAKNLK